MGEDAGQDALLIAELRRLRMVQADQLDRLAQRAATPGMTLDLLVQTGWLLPEQLRRVNRTLGRKILTCFICLKKTALQDSEWTGSYFCEYCYKTVGIAEGTTGFDDELLLDPAERLLDEFVAQRLLKLRHLEPEQLDSVRAERMTIIPRPSLVALLQDEGHLSAAALDGVVTAVKRTIQERFPAFAALERDSKLARQLLRRGFVSQEGVAAALGAQLDAALKQLRYQPLVELLCQRDELTEQQAAYVVPHLLQDLLQDLLQTESAPPRDPEVTHTRQAGPSVEDTCSVVPPIGPNTGDDAETQATPATHSGGTTPATVDAEHDATLAQELPPADPAPCATVTGSVDPQHEQSATPAGSVATVAAAASDSGLPATATTMAQGSGHPLDEPALRRSPLENTHRQPLPVQPPRKGLTHRYAVGTVAVAAAGQQLPVSLTLKPVANGARMPQNREDRGDAGLDLACLAEVTIAPGTIARIPLGLASSFPANAVVLLADRSSMAARGLHVVGGVIDSSYRGEWVVMLANLSSEPQRLLAGDRIAQALVLERPSLAIAILAADEELPSSERGAAGFGSTGA
jgi:dUTP pyrophosphatase